MEAKDRDIERYILDSVLNKGTRIIKWLIIVIVILILALIGTNLAWTIYENQFETIETTQENDVVAWQDGDENTVVGGDMYVETSGAD